MATNETTRVLRIFKLIQYLDDYPPKNVERLADLLEVSDKTIYRYLKLIEEIGYEIEKDHSNHYSLVFDARKYNFEEQEKKLIVSLIKASGQEETIERSILNKLKFTSQLADPILLNNMKQLRWIKDINEAIRLKLPLTLINYKSTSADSTIKDRIVQPVYFDENRMSITAYEYAVKEYRIFKLSRIEHLDGAKSKINRDLPENLPIIDMFGFSGQLQYQIKLRLTQLAKSILVEEFPSTFANISGIADGRFVYEFNGNVSGYEAIGRFVLGFIGDIKVISDDGFKDYLKTKLNSQTILTD